MTQRHKHGDEYGHDKEYRLVKLPPWKVSELVSRIPVVLPRSDLRPESRYVVDATVETLSLNMLSTNPGLVLAVLHGFPILRCSYGRNKYLYWVVTPASIQMSFLLQPSLPSLSLPTRSIYDMPVYTSIQRHPRRH